MDLDFSIGFLSFSSCAVLSLFLLIIHFVSVARTRRGRPFLLLILATLAWGFLLGLSQLGATALYDLVMVAELLRYLVWIYVLQIAAGLEYSDLLKPSTKQMLAPAKVLIVFAIALVLVVFDEPFANLLTNGDSVHLHVGMMLALSVFGLLIVEQFFRNTPQDQRWAVNFLCLSAATIFVYDFFVYSNAFMLQQLDYEFWSARGVVNAFVVPAMVIAAVRNPQLASSIHVSRTFVFHSTTLFGSGIYLVLMALVGYYIRESSGEWGKVLHAAFLIFALGLLASLFLSTTIKTRIRRYLAYSFRNKYDYREEWTRFSQTLLASGSELSLYQRSLKAIAQIVDSEGGSLWIRDTRNFALCAEYGRGATGVSLEADDSILVRFILQHKGVFTRNQLSEFAIQNDVRQHWFIESAKHWLIVPLWVKSDLFGFVHLDQSIVGMELDLEDQDLLNTVAHHVALSLSLKETDNELQQARQFKEMNQMTAFLMHDLKTVLSQLSLLVENGRIHKNNPDFVDDMLNTVEHVNSKMQRLVQQLRDPKRIPRSGRNNLATVVKDVLLGLNVTDVTISFDNLLNADVEVDCNRENLISAIKHIVQNAVESCDRDGRVDIVLTHESEDEILLRVIDSGKGMSREFIAERLFQPFDSTKGVTGMGVGVYQSRTFFRSIGGDISVQSDPGKGSTFLISIPVGND